MGLVPDTKPAKVAFFKSKITPWTDSAVEIGTSTTAVAALDVLVTAAETALLTQTTSEAAFRTSVAAADEAVEAMAKAGADIISAIRTKARTAGNGVYNLAQIPAPATPSGKGAPGEPGFFKVELQNNGALTLTWKCANPAGTSGTSYMVWRRIGTEQLAFLGATGLKKFVDATIPAGTAMATYQIQAFRSTMAGPWAQFNVNFTTEIGGAMSAMVSPQSAKIAA